MDFSQKTHLLRMFYFTDGNISAAWKLISTTTYVKLTLLISDLSRNGNMVINCMYRYYFIDYINKVISSDVLSRLQHLVVI